MPDGSYLSLVFFFKIQKKQKNKKNLTMSGVCSDCIVTSLHQYQFEAGYQFMREALFSREQ